MAREIRRTIDELGWARFVRIYPDYGLAAGDSVDEPDQLDEASIDEIIDDYETPTLYKTQGDISEEDMKALLANLMSENSVGTLNGSDVTYSEWM